MAFLKHKNREFLAGLGFIFPNLIGFVVFTSIPIVASAVLSLYDWDMFHKPTFVGLDNFKELLSVSFDGGNIKASDPEFWKSVFNTVFMMMAIPSQIALSLMLAVLLNRKLHGEKVLAGQGWVVVQMGSGACFGMAAAFLSVIAGKPILLSLGIGMITWLAVTGLMFTLFRQQPSWAGRVHHKGWPILKVVIGIVTGLLVTALAGSIRGQWAIGIGLGLVAGGALFFMLSKAIVSARVLFFLPSVTSGVAIYLIWTWLFNANNGPINGLLGSFNIPGPDWLSGAFFTTNTTGKSDLWWFWSKPAIMIMGTWIAMGGTNMILYLAALQGINPQLYEAAEIDGATHWKKFAHITLPLLAPTTFFISITSVIYGFQGGFNAAYVMTNGGPEGSSMTISYYIFRQAFDFFRMGYAAAIAWVLFALVFVFTLAIWKRGGKGTVN